MREISRHVIAEHTADELERIVANNPDAAIIIPNDDDGDVTLAVELITEQGAVLYIGNERTYSTWLIEQQGKQ